MKITLSIVLDYLKDHWKTLVAGIFVGFAIVAIIFSLPLVTISRETTQTEYAIEMRQETYMANEPYITTGMVEKAKVVASGFYKVTPSGIVIPFTVDNPGSRLIGQFENAIQGSFNVFSASNHIIWETLDAKGTIDLPLPPGDYSARFRENLMWGEDCYIYLAISWSEAEQVVGYQQVISYREVPIKVERQKIIITEDRVSIWKYLFSRYWSVSS